MKRPHISRDHINYTLGLVAGLAGIGLFVYASYLNPIQRQDIPSASAATTSYNSQWLMTQVRHIQIYNKNNSTLWGGIDVGPAEWQVRSCIGADFATEGDYASFGTCPPGVTTVSETWTVPPFSWAAPNNLFDVGNGGVKFTPVGINRPRPAIPSSNHLRVNNGGGEGRGWVFRSGLYGVMFSTDDDGVSANGKGKWWAHSEIPMKWRVRGSITTP